MKIILAIVLVCLGSAVSLGLLLSPEITQGQEPSEVRSGKLAGSGQGSSSAISIGPAGQLPQPSAPQRLAIPGSDWQPDPAVVAELRQSFHEGDPRAPVIGKATPRVIPDELILDRPDLYEEFEANQEKKLHIAFISAAREKEAWLQEEIRSARLGGLADEQLREGEEKLRRIREMRRSLEERHAH